jgi:hypothetical protein
MRHVIHFSPIFNFLPGINKIKSVFKKSYIPIKDLILEKLLKVKSFGTNAVIIIHDINKENITYLKRARE